MRSPHCAGLRPRHGTGEQAKTAQPVEWEARLGLAEARARMGQTAEVFEELESIDPEARSPLVLIALGR